MPCTLGYCVRWCNWYEVMDSYADIESVLPELVDPGADLGGDVVDVDDSISVRGTGDYSDKINVLGGDEMALMRTQIVRLINDNVELKRRVSELEGKVKAVLINSPANQKKTFMKMRKSTMFDSEDHVKKWTGSLDTPSENPQENSASEASYGFVSTPHVDNPFLNMSAITGPSSSSGQQVFKNNSATASKGYAKKDNVWGTAMASFLVAATRYYIMKTKSDFVAIDEKDLAKNCTVVVPVLYESVMYKKLPDVKSRTTLYLADMISRTSKDDVPLSVASDWMEMQKYQDGRDVLSIINGVIQALSRVPEVIRHPVSQIIPNLIVPVVRMRDDEAIFAMSADSEVCLQPSIFEVYCSILKKEAITKYIKYRMSGMKGAQTVARLVTELRPSDLTDSKNVEKMKNLVPYTRARADD